MLFPDPAAMEVPDAVLLQLARTIVKRPEPVSLLEVPGKKVICPVCGMLSFGPYLKANKSRGKVYSYPSIKHTRSRSPWCTISRALLIRSGVTLTREQLESYTSQGDAQSTVQPLSRREESQPTIVVAPTARVAASVVPSLAAPGR